MTSPSLYHLFIKSLALVLATPTVIWWLVITGILRALFSLPDQSHQAGVSRPLMLLFLITTIATPVLYGLYFAKIERRSEPLADIARKHIFNYLVLLFKMYLPAVAIALLPSLLNRLDYHPGYFHLTLIFFSLLYIYVIPTYYLSGSLRGAIGTGIQTLVQNLSISTPLLLILLALESTILLAQFYHEAIVARSTQLFLVVDFSLYFIASLIDFALFIMLVILLKTYDEGEAPRT